MGEKRRLEFDLLIIGGGISGLCAAISAAESGLSVAILAKETDPLESNTRYAQGGIVGRSPEDKIELLEEDIIKAGSGINSREAVHLLAKQGPELVESFLADKIQVQFTREKDGKLALTREAAHSIRRIMYAKDRTGAEIQNALVSYLAQVNGIQKFYGHTAIDLITNVHNSTDSQERYRGSRVIGAYALDEQTSTVSAFFAPVVILAAGGAGNLFRHTSNPVGATGDGIAMAYRIGLGILNAEYVQFHPTVLFHRDVKRFLISETLRGEGAKLMNSRGEYFMEKYNSVDADLASRDEVARAIYREMESNDTEYVFLDASKITGFPLEERFPSIYQQCWDLGIDIKTEPIPVVPAAHYFCGGVKVNLNGETANSGLFVAGENACTGIHGANRLASVSLLEGMFWGLRCGALAAERRYALSPNLINSIPDWIEPVEVEDADPVLIKQDYKTIQSTMWNYAGIIRSRKRLLRALADLDYLSHRIEQFYRGTRLTRQVIELRNSVLTASIIVRAALVNPVSKGCHYIEEVGKDGTS